MNKTKLKLREDFTKGHVVVYDGRKAVFSNSEYSFAAKWVKERYGLGDGELIALYRSYKKDYDKRR